MVPNRSDVRRSLLRGDSDVIGCAGNAVRHRSSGIFLGLRRLHAPCTPRNKLTSTDLATSWRTRRPVYAPTTASSSPSKNRCRTHCLSRNAIGRRRTSARVLPREPREAKSFARHAPTHAFITAVRPRGAALRGRSARAAAALSSDPPSLRIGVKPCQWDPTNG